MNKEKSLTTLIFPLALITKNKKEKGVFSSQFFFLLFQYMAISFFFLKKSTKYYFEIILRDFL